MLQLPRRGQQPTESPYAGLGVRDLPFPNVAVLDPYNTDPRRNGSIFAEEPVRSSIDKFEQLLIRPNDFLNRARLAYLWSKGDLETGRGMGKTALLRYFRQRINQDWGQTEFSGSFSGLVVYVSFPAQVDRRYMEQLALSALVDICKNGVLEASRAALRLQQLTEQQVRQVVTNSDGSEDPANLLNDEILQAEGIDAGQLDETVTRQLVAEGVQPGPASALGRAISKFILSPSGGITASNHSMFQGTRRSWISRVFFFSMTWFSICGPLGLREDTFS